jgi:GDP-L-fucose synthase
MNILIFGSNGLVGKSLNKILSKVSEYNIISSTRNETDLFNFKQTSEKISKVKPDVIINCAAKVGGIYANDTKRTQFLIENLKINLNILESSMPFNEIKIINLGSSCIYPLNAENPIKEDSFMDGKLEPTNSPYAMAKLTSIELGRSISSEYGHKIVNLMPTNLYGPNDNFDEEYSHVIPGLISRMHEAKKINAKEFGIWGSGMPLREFLYVDDLSNCINFIIQNKIDSDLLNVGSGVEISILDLAKKIKTLVGFEGELNFDNTKPDGNPRKLLDSTYINNLGWEASTNLDDGLKKTYSWFKENIA